MERSPNLDFNLNLHYIKKREIFPQNLSMKASSKAWFQQFSFKITKPNNKFGSEKWGSMKFLVMAIGDGGSRRWWCLWEAILVKIGEGDWSRKYFFWLLAFFFQVRLATSFFFFLFPATNEKIWIKLTPFNFLTEWQNFN